ncbi:MAG: hypothetical protein ACM3X6_15115 [Patescibacteria group bacterium]
MPRRARRGLIHHTGRVFKAFYQNLERLLVLNLAWFLSATPGAAALLLWSHLGRVLRLSALAWSMITLPAVIFVIYWAIGYMLDPFGGVPWDLLRRDRWRLLRRGYQAVAPVLLCGFLLGLAVLATWRPAGPGVNLLAVAARLFTLIFAVLATLWWPLAAADPERSLSAGRRAMGYFLARPFGVTGAALLCYLFFALAIITMAGVALIGFSLLALGQSYYLRYLEGRLPGETEG